MKCTAAQVMAQLGYPSGLVSHAKDKFPTKERGRWQIASRLRGAGGRSKESNALNVLPPNTMPYRSRIALQLPDDFQWEVHSRWKA
jgi:hypothetical protein